MIAGLRTIHPLVLALAAIALLALSACGRGPADPSALARSGPVVLVVTGAGAPADAGQGVAYEGLYAMYGIELQGARAFSRPELTAMSWRQMRVDFPVGGSERVFEGPRLSDVLRAAGIPGASVRLTAFDGYEAEVPADIDRKSVV